MFANWVRWFHQMGSPAYFYDFVGRWLPWLLGATGIAMAIGIAQALFLAPADYLQGENVRILYIHVPCAWMSLFVYAFMGVQAASVFIWRIKLCEWALIASAPIGAAFTVATLVTGSLWGRPTWGTYWVWDARLTSELILLFLYFGIIGLYYAIEDHRKAARAAGLLAIIGLVNLPIIRYSVEWWSTLHQGPSIKLFSAKNALHPSMWQPLIWMLIATKLYFAASLLQRVRNLILIQEKGKSWLARALGGADGGSRP